MLLDTPEECSNISGIVALEARSELLFEAAEPLTVLFEQEASRRGHALAVALVERPGAIHQHNNLAIAVNSFIHDAGNSGLLRTSRCRERVPGDAGYSYEDKGPLCESVMHIESSLQLINYRATGASDLRASSMRFRNRHSSRAPSEE